MTFRFLFFRITGLTSPQLNTAFTEEWQDALDEKDPSSGGLGTSGGTGAEEDGGGTAHSISSLRMRAGRRISLGNTSAGLIVPEMEVKPPTTPLAYS